MRNEKGFIMIQVIIVAVIISFLSLVMGSLILQQRMATGYLEDQLERLQAIRYLEAIIVDNLACQLTFQGMAVPAGNNYLNVNELKDRNGNLAYESNSIVNKLNIGQMRIQNESVLAPNSTGYIEIEVPFSRTRLGGGPEDFRSFKSKVLVTVDAASRVTTCSSSKINLQQYMTAIGGDKDETTFLSCGPGESPISCGIDKMEETDEDSLNCYLDIINTRCVFRRDRSGNGIAIATGYCYCS